MNAILWYGAKWLTFHHTLNRNRISSPRICAQVLHSPITISLLLNPFPCQQCMQSIHLKTSSAHASTLQLWTSVQECRFIADHYLPTLNCCIISTTRRFFFFLHQFKNNWMKHSWNGLVYFRLKFNLDDTELFVVFLHDLFTLNRPIQKVNCCLVNRYGDLVSPSTRPRELEI